LGRVTEYEGRVCVFVGAGEIPGRLKFTPKTPHSSGQS
jgi:hypothetical protein